MVNISAEWARATRKLTSPYTSYTRRGFTADYTRTFAKKLRLEAGINGNIGGMNSVNDPDAFSNEYTVERDNLLTPHLKLTWLLNRSWVTNCPWTHLSSITTAVRTSTGTIHTRHLSRQYIPSRKATGWLTPCP